MRNRANGEPDGGEGRAHKATPGFMPLSSERNGSATRDLRAREIGAAR
jgi:hypothetical protein